MSEVLKSIKKIAEGIYKKIKKTEQPILSSPLRSLANVNYDINLDIKFTKSNMGKNVYLHPFDTWLTLELIPE